MNAPSTENSSAKDAMNYSCDFGKFKGVYYTSTPTTPRFLFPLLLERNGDVYIAKQKITCKYDPASATLSFESQVIDNQSRSGSITFFEDLDRRQTCVGHIMTENPSSRDDITGIKILKTQVWATPATSSSLQESSLEHTWIAMSDANCWRIMGGGPGHYCGDNKWLKVGDTLIYFPPEGRLLSSIDAGDPAKANCLGGEESKFLNVLGWYAGIVYGVNGVCHQMANRLLLSADKLTVSGAKGYILSCIQFGRYGTIGSIEFVVTYFGWMVLIVLVPALVAFLAGAQIELGTRCGRCDAPYPGPLLVRKTAEEELQRIRSMSIDEFNSFLLEMYDRHLADLNELFREKAGEHISEVKIGALIALYREMLVPSKVHVTGLFELMQSPLVQRLDDIHFDTSHKIDFANKFNDRVNQQQFRAAQLLTREEYIALFDFAPDRRVVLVDPQIMSR